MTARAPHPDWVVPRWPVPPRVHAFVTTRAGGVSQGPYAAGDAGGLNVGLLGGDDAQHVHENRRRLREALPAEPRWLRLVHGATVIDAATVDAPVEADASFTSEANVVCAVTVADCLPVFLADRDARCVGVAHAGWRSLAAGVLQRTARAMRERLGDPQATLCAWLGPAIGPEKFEVGRDVLEAMRALLPHAEAAFRPIGAGKFLASLAALARQALALEGIDDAGGGDLCTYSDARRFYSFRRDRVTGRHAAVIWLE